METQNSIQLSKRANRMSRKRIVEVNYPSGRGVVLYHGPKAECPSTPKVGETVKGPYGDGIVSVVNRYSDETHDNIVIKFE
jgi:hypothetical protein